VYRISRLFAFTDLEFDRVADIDDEEEGGIVVGDGADVGFGLGLGAQEGVVPELGAADAVAFLELGRGGGGDIGRGLGILLFDALLGFQWDNGGGWASGAGEGERRGRGGEKDGRGG
jgi:hypothetical protein